MRAIVPLALSLPSGVSGNADLRYTSLTYIGPDVSPCSSSSAGTNSVFQVSRLAIDFNVFEGGRSGAGFTARDWSSVGGAIYARKTYQSSSAFADETTIFNLKHTPK